MNICLNYCFWRAFCCWELDYGVAGRLVEGLRTNMKVIRLMLYWVLNQSLFKLLFLKDILLLRVGLSVCWGTGEKFMWQTQSQDVTQKYNVPAIPKCRSTSSVPLEPLPIVQHIFPLKPFQYAAPAQNEVFLRELAIEIKLIFPRTVFDFWLKKFVIVYLTSSSSIILSMSASPTQFIQSRQFIQTKTITVNYLLIRTPHGNKTL